MTHIFESRDASYCTPNKTKYSSHISFGLNISKISITTYLPTIHHILRYSFHNGPKKTKDAVISALLTSSQDPNLLQYMTASSANFLDYHCHNIPHVQPCPVNQITTQYPTGEALIYYQSTAEPPTSSTTQNSQYPKGTAIWHLSILHHPNQQKSTVTVRDMIAQMTSNNRFHLLTNTTMASNAISFPIQPPNPPANYLLSECLHQLSFESFL